jgi:hypothetical protein
MVGPNWPNGGEIDIIEGVNTNNADQVRVCAVLRCARVCAVVCVCGVCTHFFEGIRRRCTPARAAT